MLTTILDKNDKSIIMGDLNGSTKTADDFVRDSLDKHSPINNLFYVKDQVLNRTNMDNTSIDGQGKMILEFCKSSSYRILNGRTHGTKWGKLLGTHLTYEKTQV